MIVTEEEAKEKWCPHARVTVDDTQGSYNRLVQREPITVYAKPTGSRCIASECMAWTWVEPDKLRDIDLVTGDVEPGRKGRCGLITKCS